MRSAMGSRPAAFLPSLTGIGLAVICSAGATRAQTSLAAQPEIDLKLFAKAEVDRTKGCTVALWQGNRDPEKDQYAFLFIEQLTGKSNNRQPARIKVGAQAMTLQRVAAGGKTNGYGLYEYQLYKLAGEDGFVILDLKLGELEGEAVAVEDGAMTVVMRGRQTFRASVKGGAGCWSAPLPDVPAKSAPQLGKKAASDGAAALSAGGAFVKYDVRASRVPNAVLQAAIKKYKCEPEVMKTGVTGFQLSEESAIWDIPCERFAYQGSSVFALVYLPDPANNLSFLSFQSPKGKKRSTDAGVLLNPVWNVKARTVTSASLGRAAGDCGTLETHRVTAEGRFELIEYREKESCDGKALPPEQFPLVFRLK